MKKYLHIIFVILLASCTNKNSQQIEKPVLFPQPQSVKLNSEEGYTINSVSGDSIKPLVNSLGDTIKTGVPIPAIGKVISLDSLDKPIVVSVPKELTSKNAHPNVYKIPTELTTIPIKQDSLKSILLAEIAKNDTSHYITNSEGKKVKTGIHIPVKGKEVLTTQPNPTPALPPRFKDNAITDLQYLDVDQGMPSSYVRSILEDQSGNLWFGTYGGGVTKYNGEEFTHYTEKEGLSNNYVRSILEDQSGNLWFGTEGGGVTKYNGKVFTHYTEKEGLSNNVVLSILEDQRGNLWFGTEGGGVTKYNGKEFTHYTEKEGLSNNIVWSILEDQRGNLWFGTPGGGVTKYNGEEFTHYTEKEGLSNNLVVSILEDQSGNLWFGTSGGGVTKYNGEEFTHYTEKEGLSSNVVVSILEDQSGNLWFGTYGGGVTKYNGEVFTHYTEKEGLSNNVVWSIFEDQSGNLWFGTHGGGVMKYKGEVFTHYTEKGGLSNNVVRSILEDQNGNLWFGTYGGGVTKYNGEEFTHYTKKEGLSNNYVRSILEDQSGNLWFGTDGGGVTKYNGEEFTYYTKKEGLSNNLVRSILEDQSGNLWFGTYGGGVTKYNGEEFTHYTEKEGLSNNVVRSILEDRSGNLWFGTYGGGVTKYNGEEFTHYTEKEGLSSNLVLSILEDQSGSIWVTTEKGITNLRYGGNISSYSKYDQKTEKVSIQVFEKQDGLKGVDFYANSVLLDSKNRAWWGSGKSLTMLNFNNFRLSQKPPAIQLNRVEINEQFLDYRRERKPEVGDRSQEVLEGVSYDSVLAFYNCPLNLKLPYDRNHLTFHFSAIDWLAPHKIQYSYLIEGLNDNWSQPSKEAKAEYRNLPYGKYTFKVMAIGESGEWSEAFGYEFTVLPPWWHTWWARTGYGLAAFILVFGVVRWRTAQLKQRQKELEIEVNNATEEIRAQRDAIGQQHEEITASINYAKSIQRALLRVDKEILKHFPPFFILYLPRDVVSGDFYWATEKNGYIYCTAADCTGHGVPGAFMSMLGISFLNEIMNSDKILTPAEILDQLRARVIKELGQGVDGKRKDGMDMGLVRLNLKTKELVFAGANNPLYIVTNDPQKIEKASRVTTIDGIENSIVEFKATKQPVGYQDKSGPFENVTLKVKEGEQFYLFSDGFADQFGGPRNKKYGYLSFREFILGNSLLDVLDQHEKLKEEFISWVSQGTDDQIDDVCVIGVKI